MNFRVSLCLAAAQRADLSVEADMMRNSGSSSNGGENVYNIAACQDHPLITMTSFLLRKQPLQGAAFIYS